MSMGCVLAHRLISTCMCAVGRVFCVCPFPFNLQVESDVYERVYQRCQSERMAQHRAFTWGNREAARRMELTSCQELSRLHERMGSHRQGTVFG